MKAQRDTTRGVCFIAAMFATSANAECPQNLPTQLLEDCIVIEGSGSSFPHPDYAHMAAYKAWLAKQAPSVQPAAGSSSTIAGSTDAMSK